MKGRAIHYSAEEMTWLEANRAMVISEYHSAFCNRFCRDDVSAGHLHALRKRKEWKTGRLGCFEKGMTPHNKGKPCPPGRGGHHPNARKTQFKKGRLPHNHKGSGHERTDTKDGYVIMIVGEKNPRTGAATRPVNKHRWRWEKQNCPVPDGYVLKCRDGNRQNTDPSNWEPVPRALLPRLSGRYGRDYDGAPAEIKPAIMAISKLEHKAREVGRP